MASVNKAIVIGFVGNDPQVNTTRAGAEVASFSIATSKKWRDKQGERREQTQWHRIVCFNENLVKVIKQYIKKGSQVFVEGEMQTRSYDDKEGIKRYTTEIVLSSFNSQLVLCDKAEGGSRPPPPEDEHDYGKPIERSYGTHREEPAQRNAGAEIDDEIPF